MWITIVYYHVRQDDKYGLSQGFLSNRSEIALELFDQHIAHRDVCGKCLQEKTSPTSGLDHSILSFMQSSANYSPHPGV